MKHVVLSLFIIVTLISCESFDEGGLVSKADKRLTESWVLDTYYRNDMDESSLIYISGYQESYKDDGTYMRSYMNNDGNPVSEEGTWELTSDQTQIRIMGVSSIENFSDANSTLSSATYIIIKLKGDELWYEYENGGDMHQFRLSMN